MCWRVGSGAGAVLAPPEQPPRGACGSRVTSRLGKSFPSTALWAQAGAARTGPPCSLELKYSYASKNPKPTQQTKSPPQEISNHYQLTLCEQSLSPHSFAMDFHGVGITRLSGALPDCWSQSCQWQRCYLSPKVCELSAFPNALQAACWVCCRIFGCPSWARLLLNN